jgi:DNA-binding XRE family transcriptional regulator
MTMPFRGLLQIFCQNAFCRRLYNIVPTIGWVQSGAADFQKRLGARVREIRTAQEFSQEGFAEACGLHRTHISLLERGRINVTVNTVRQIAIVLRISLAELFRGLD